VCGSPAPPRSVARRHRGGLELELLLRDAARPSDKRKGEDDADTGEDGDREEGSLEALRERDQRALAGVRRQVVLRARHGHGRDDGDAECRSDLELVLLRPEASPDSRPGTPPRAAIKAVTKTKPTPGPKTSSPRKMSPK
jgi:hypothetical protein